MRACRPAGDELTRPLDHLSRRIARVLERRGLLIAVGPQQGRNHYNTKRPHIALGYRPPAHCVAQYRERVQAKLTRVSLRDTVLQ